MPVPTSCSICSPIIVAPIGVLPMTGSDLQWTPICSATDCRPGPLVAKGDAIGAHRPPADELQPVKPPITPVRLAVITEPVCAVVAEHQPTSPQTAIDANPEETVLAKGVAWTPGIHRNLAARAPRSAPNGRDTTSGRRPGCRTGGCARLCTSEGLAVAYRACRLPLLGRARAILGDAALAEDAVQETFIRAWRACATFDPDGPPMLNWLSVIMRNVALDLLKARSRRPRLLRSEPIEHAEPPARISDIDLMLLRTVLANALAGIGVQHRAAVVETILLGRPHEEVAAELGVPVGTLRSRVHYALRRLRRQLQNQDDERQPGTPAREPSQSALTQHAPADQADPGGLRRQRRAA